MSERDDFLKWVDTELHDAESALHDGDPNPRLAIWSTRDPVTVFGAWLTSTTSVETQALFHRLETKFSGNVASDFELVSADAVGDLAYTIGYEHTTTHVDGERRTYTLRATQLYRREGGAWKVFHRHADDIEPVSPFTEEKP
jgi:ketosteroid isomerase-like protein